MRLIGITGPTGAGKSTVCALLRARGFFVLDGDALAREVVVPGAPLLGELAAAFGAEILAGDTLNRRALAERAFASTENTKKLNTLMHPAIFALMQEKLRVCGKQLAFIEGAALLESPLAAACDAIVAVLAPEDERRARILRRDGLSDADARLRMNAQRADAYYAARAQFVIINDKANPLAPQVEAMLCEV
ncbi:MAG: dephospho-CoA kinase [Oscillospiraceae bacterium]|jgi:dephospho-CoA kinase|nr:dephospho-CoA kinase [Oscillospiraceae bacterium]